MKLLEYTGQCGPVHIQSGFGLVGGNVPGGQCSQNRILFKFSEYQLIPNTRYYVAIELYFPLGYANTGP